MINVDVLIIGGGVTGTSLAYVLGQFTDVKNVVVLEKNGKVSMVNSHPLNNSQTSHDGGTETNYTLEHALKVKQAAIYLRSYVKSKKDDSLFCKTKRMVIGVGREEASKLSKRFREFSPHYPDITFVFGDTLRAIEPNVIENRNPSEPVVGIVSSEGYAIDYQKLSEHFAIDAEKTGKVKILFNTKVLRVVKNKQPVLDSKWFVETNNGDFLAKVVVFAAGPYSLLFAQELGYGLDYGILPVAGSFFSAGNLLNNKVYRVQIEGRPFAEIHGDPDVLNSQVTRFGPTTKPLPLMERHQYETLFDFLKLPIVSWRGFKATFKIMRKNNLFKYVFVNMLYDIPVLGKLLFLREAKIIVPSLRYRDLELRRGVGGIRPQIVDLKTGELLMGDATIVGDNIIFNTTPSPGASVCLANAKRDAQKVMQFLENPDGFKIKSFEEDLSS